LLRCPPDGEIPTRHLPAEGKVGGSLPPLINLCKLGLALRTQARFLVLGPT
jgi:hypothetical protein